MTGPLEDLVNFWGLFGVYGRLKILKICATVTDTLLRGVRGEGTGCARPLCCAHWLGKHCHQGRTVRGASAYLYRFSPCRQKIVDEELNFCKKDFVPPENFVVAREFLPNGTMKNPIKTTLVIFSLVVAAANSSSAATSIGASFVGRNATPADVLAPTDSTGVVAQQNWYNVFDDGSTFKGATASLMDSAGNFTSVKIVFNASDSWSSDGPTVTPDDKLMKGIIKANPDPDTAPANNTDRMLFVITNLPPSGSYNVIVYAMENGAGAEMDVSGGSTTYDIE